VLFVDIETTGVEHEDKICSCGLVDGNTQLYELYNEKRKISSKASSIHHITNEDIADKKPFCEGEIYRYLQTHNTQADTWVVHNGAFIFDMLSSHGFFFNAKMVDTKKVAKHLMPELESYALEFLRYECKLYKQEQQSLPWSALGDAYVIEALYNYLLELVSLEEMYTLSVTPVLLERFSFGKYKAHYIEEICLNDRGYVQWMLSLDGIDEDLRYSLQYYLKG
jgi:DNA polymerase-3 subunit epsilon/exodeoxyribonuclease X